ncbi:MAG TPA: hypothetical protein VLL54_03010 [Pyrinomonadaceae bacterium]|nr:hypothetical protein [Pyrinomonadaceae bacterium]
MVNANSEKSGAQAGNPKELAKRKSDATSGDTLSELEENETYSHTTDGDPLPSPDGSIDNDEERKDAGKIEADEG